MIIIPLGNAVIQTNCSVNMFYMKNIRFCRSFKENTFLLTHPHSKPQHSWCSERSLFYIINTLKFVYRILENMSEVVNFAVGFPFSQNKFFHQANLQNSFSRDSVCSKPNIWTPIFPNTFYLF